MDDGYPVGIVGEIKYQPAIKRCRIGDKVSLFHEQDNPHDGSAVVVQARGATIGYLPREHWLKRAMLDEGKVGVAVIKSIDAAGTARRTLGVVLQVHFATHDELAAVNAAVADRPSSWTERLFRYFGA